MNIRVHEYFWMRVLSIYMPRRGIVGSYGTWVSILTLPFIIKFATVCLLSPRFLRCKVELLKFFWIVVARIKGSDIWQALKNVLQHGNCCIVLDHNITVFLLLWALFRELFYSSGYSSWCLANSRLFEGRGGDDCEAGASAFPSKCRVQRRCSVNSWWLIDS